MRFSIKYTAKDYFNAVKFKMSKALLIVQQTKGNKFEVLIFRIISPFVIFSIVIIATLKRLKPNYDFILSNSGITRKINEREDLAKWSRFICYEETKNFIALQFNKYEGDNDGQVLFPKRCFDETEWLRLIEIFEDNHISSGEIDLNMDI